MKKEIILYGLSAIVLLSVLAMVVPASAVQMADEFGVSDTSGDIGTYVAVPVNITAVANGPIQTIKFDVLYDHSILELDYDNDYALLNGDLTTGTMWTFALGSNEKSITVTTSKLIQAIPNGPTGSVVLLNFSVIGTGESIMNMSNIDFANTANQHGTAPAKNGTFTVLGEADDPPYLVTYTISNTTISPDGDGVKDDTSIDVEFSETVAATISIEDSGRNLVKQLYSNSGVKNPGPKVWDGTDSDGIVVPEGDYYVNITMDDGVNPLVYNNTETITVSIPEAPPEEYSVSITADATAKTTTPTVNAAYTLTVKNTGTNMDNYTLSVDNVSSADVAELSKYAITNLAADATEDVTLYVGNPTAGTFIVNVTVTSDTDPANATDMVSTTTTVTPIDITDFEVSDGTLGSDLEASVTISNKGTSEEWFIVKVTGVNIATGYPLVGTGVVRLDVDESVTIPLLVYVPDSADEGTYNLFANVWIYADYPDLDKTFSAGPEVATVTSP